MVKKIGTPILNHLGRMMASEGLTFIEGDFKTAFINLRSRVIHLPRWTSHTEDMAIMLRSHELSHALHTPPRGFHQSILKKNTPAFAGYLNVVEDSRIERIIQQKFPGLIPHFIAGYKDAVELGIFDSERYGKIMNVEDYSEFMLIDRINLHEKIGAHVDVPFLNEEEEHLLLRTQTCATWKQIVEVAHDIFEYDKRQIEQQQQESGDQNEEGEGEGEEGQGDGGNLMYDGESQPKSGKGQQGSGKGQGQGGSDGDDDDQIPQTQGNDLEYDEDEEGSDLGDDDSEDGDDDGGDTPDSVERGSIRRQYQSGGEPQSLTDESFRKQERRFYKTLAPPGDEYATTASKISKTMKSPDGVVWEMD